MPRGPSCIAVARAALSQLAHMRGQGTLFLQLVGTNWHADFQGTIVLHPVDPTHWGGPHRQALARVGAAVAVVPLQGPAVLVLWISQGVPVGTPTWQPLDAPRET